MRIYAEAAKDNLRISLRPQETTRYATCHTHYDQRKLVLEEKDEMKYERTLFSDLRTSR
jgi:hypothetical protein